MHSVASRDRWGRGVRIISLLVVLGGGTRAAATAFTETSPTAGGESPFTLAPVGGIVFDGIGLNGNRVISQLTASALAGNANYNSSPVTLGTQNGFTDAITDELGGGFEELAFRLTANDWDNAAGELDFNAHTLRLNGIDVGNPSTVVAQATNDAGTPGGAGFSGGGFRNNQLDTGWLLVSDPAVLAAVFAAIEADDQIDFDYTDTSSNGNGIDFSRGVDAAGAGLTLGPVLIQTLENVANTPTQREVGRALDAQAGAGNDLETVLTTILTLPAAADKRAALDAVAGRIAFMAGDSAIGAAETQGFNLDSRLSALRRGEAPASSGLQLAYADDPLGVRGGWARYVSDEAGDVMDDAAPALPLGRAPGGLPEDPYGLFALGSLTVSDTAGSAAQVGSEVLAAGITLGFDARLDEQTVLGLALGFGDNDTDFDDDSSFAAESYTLSLYATRTLGESWYVDGAVGLTYSEAETTRRIVLPGIDRTARGETQGLAWSAMGRVVYEAEFDGWTLAPETSLRYADATIDGYTERDAGGLSLSFDDQHAESLVWSLGATLRRSFALNERATLTPYVGLSLESELLDDSRTITTAFAGDPTTPFATFTDSPDRTFGRARLGVTGRLGRNLSAYADYATLVGHDDTDAHQFFAGLRWGF
jgi:uncharacterized protein YhjY with autotransporter beta-barrel domain